MAAASQPLMYDPTRELQGTATHIQNASSMLTSKIGRRPISLAKSFGMWPCILKAREGWKKVVMSKYFRIPERIAVTSHPLVPGSTKTYNAYVDAACRQRTTSKIHALALDISILWCAETLSEQLRLQYTKYIQHATQGIETWWEINKYA